MSRPSFLVIMSTVLCVDNVFCNVTVSVNINKTIHQFNLLSPTKVNYVKSYKFIEKHAATTFERMFMSKYNDKHIRNGWYKQNPEYIVKIIDLWYDNYTLNKRSFLADISEAFGSFEIAVQKYKSIGISSRNTYTERRVSRMPRGFKMLLT